MVRETVMGTMSPLLQSEIINRPGEDGLFDFENFLLGGFGGVVIVKHFSLRDPLQTIKDILVASDIIRQREILAALARHRANVVAMLPSKLIDLKVRTIVTQNSLDDAVKKSIYPLPKLNEGVPVYIRDALEVISNGGVVPVAPEGERRDNLELYAPSSLHRTKKERENHKIRTIGTMLAWAQRLGVENIAFLFVDLRVSGKDRGYWESGWFNLGHKYEIRIGRVLTSKQIMEMADGNIRLVDRDVIHHEMLSTALIAKQ